MVMNRLIILVYWFNKLWTLATIATLTKMFLFDTLFSTAYLILKEFILNFMKRAIHKNNRSLILVFESLSIKTLKLIIDYFVIINLIIISKS